MFNPKYACLVAGASEGETELNAFDNALLEAGIGDVNLIKVSSIMPPGVEILDELKSPARGAFLPVVYATEASSRSGDKLTAAVGYGRANDGFGIIMEASGVNVSEESIRREVEDKIKFAFARRNLEAKEVRVVSTTHTVKKCGAVVAACVFLEEE